MFIYPTSKFKSSSELRRCDLHERVVLVFVFAAVVFLLHDWQMRRLHTKVLKGDTFQRHCSEFPAGVRDQLISQQNKDVPGKLYYDGKVPAKDALMDFVSDQNNLRNRLGPLPSSLP
jgi:hypothetical protein